MLDEQSLVAKVDRLVSQLSEMLAIFGGFMLAAISLLTFISILSRELTPMGFAPIPGDFELVEMGVAVAVFSFLPYCHMNKGHMLVDIFIAPLPTPIFNFTTLLGDLAVFCFSVLLSARMWLGLLEKISYKESTMILGMPLWYGYALSLAGLVVFSIVSLFIIWKDISLMAQGGRVA